MSLRDDYHDKFRQDLAVLFRGMDDTHARVMLGNDWVRECSFLPRITEVNRPSFLACLHFTVLMDQSMHAHFFPWHHQFEKLTRYPKFHVGLGHRAYLNPMFVFDVPIERGLVAESAVRALIPESMRLFVEETDDFFRRHMPQITATQFFESVIADPDVAPRWLDDEHGDAGSLPLRQAVALELKKAVSDVLTDAA